MMRCCQWVPVMAPALAASARADKARAHEVDSLPPTLLVAPAYQRQTREQLLCPGGGIGRRTSFRCWRSQGRGGSSPLLGTIPLFVDARRSSTNPRESAIY